MLFIATGRAGDRVSGLDGLFRLVVIAIRAEAPVNYPCVRRPSRRLRAPAVGSTSDGEHVQDFTAPILTRRFFPLFFGLSSRLDSV